MEEYYWAEKFDWGCTSDQYIWERSDGKYHFSNECSQFDETPYDTVEECIAALNAYTALL